MSKQFEEIKKHFPCKDCEYIIHISTYYKQCKLTGGINAYGICPLNKIKALETEKAELKADLEETLTEIGVQNHTLANAFIEIKVLEEALRLACFELDVESSEACHKVYCYSVNCHSKKCEEILSDYFKKKSKKKMQSKKTEEEI